MAVDPAAFVEALSERLSRPLQRRRPRDPPEEQLADLLATSTQLLAVALPRCRLGSFEIHSFVLTPAGLRGEVSWNDFAPVRSGEHIVPGLEVTDDGGRTHRLAIRSSRAVSGPSRKVAHLSVEIVDTELAGAHWLELNAAGLAPLRLMFQAPPTLPVGRIADPPSPAERYLERLMPVLDPTEPSPRFGVGLSARQAVEVVAGVADALLALGALPASSPLLSKYPAAPPPPLWRAKLVERWVRRACANPRLDGGVGAVALGNTLPFEKAVVAVKSLSVVEGVALVEYYAASRPSGEYWPVGVGGYALWAVDDVGTEHVASGRAFHLGEVLWPPLHPAARRLRLHVASVWEEAWIDLDLPQTA